MTRKHYDLRRLNAEGCHYVIVGVPPLQYLWMPDGNYHVAIRQQTYKIIVQVIIERKERALREEDRENTANYDALYFTHADIYVPVWGANSTIHQDQDAISNLVFDNPLFYTSIAVEALNKLITLYRHETGEYGIQPMLGLSDWDIAVLFNENPPAAQQSLFRGLGKDYSTGERLFPLVVDMPENILAHIRTGLLADVEIPLHDEMLLNAHAFLHQGNPRMAVIEAETAFEIAITKFLADYYVTNTSAIQKIEGINSFTTLLKHPLAQAALKRKGKSFSKGDPVYESWKIDVWEVRGALVHGKLSAVPSTVATKAIATVEDTLQAILDRSPTFIRRFRKME